MNAKKALIEASEFAHSAKVRCSRIASSATLANIPMHHHVPVASLTRIAGFSGPVSCDENRAAHGNICEVEYCRCGARRARNVNQCHVEQEPWDLPIRVAHEHSDACNRRMSAATARIYLSDLAASEAGCRWIRMALFRESAEAVISAPEQGTDVGTLRVAELVGRAALTDLARGS
jgi:hypothetical protein